MPDIGQRGTLNGTLVEWDGHGWMAVSDQASMPRPSAAAPQGVMDYLKMPLGPENDGNLPWGVRQAVQGTRWAGRLAREHPAQAGALAGGTAMSVATGGLGAIPAIGLVGLGGAGGAGFGLAADQLATGTPATATDNATTMATEGASMAAGEGVGRGVVAGAKAGSKYLMNRAMNNMATRLSDEFPTIAQDMIDHAISVSGGGYEKAKALLAGQKGIVRTAVATGDAAGTTIPISVATDAMTNVSEQIAHSSNIEGNFKALTKVTNQLTAGRGADLTIADADALKTSLFAEAKALLKQYQQAGVRGLPALKVEAEAKLAAARALNDAIETATTDAGAPGYQAANAGAQKMIGVTRGLKTAMRGPQNNYQALVRPGMGLLAGGAVGEQQGHPFLGAAAGAALGSPAGLSRQAITLGNPAVQAFLRQLPKPALDALLSALGATAPTPGGEP